MYRPLVHSGLLGYIISTLLKNCKTDRTTSLIYGDLSMNSYFLAVKKKGKRGLRHQTISFSRHLHNTQTQLAFEYTSEAIDKQQNVRYISLEISHIVPMWRVLIVSWICKASVAYSVTYHEHKSYHISRRLNAVYVYWNVYLLSALIALFLLPQMHCLNIYSLNFLYTCSQIINIWNKREDQKLLLKWALQLVMIVRILSTWVVSFRVGNMCGIVCL